MIVLQVFPLDYNKYEFLIATSTHYRGKWMKKSQFDNETNWYSRSKDKYDAFYGFSLRLEIEQ